MRWKMNRLLKRGKKMTIKQNESMIGSRMVQRKRDNEKERESCLDKILFRFKTTNRDIEKKKIWSKSKKK